VDFLLFFFFGTLIRRRHYDKKRIGKMIRRLLTLARSRSFGDPSSRLYRFPLPDKGLQSSRVPALGEATADYRFAIAINLF
jgi:hypothetical protein